MVLVQVRSYRSLVACIANSILYSYDAGARDSPGSHPGGRTPRLLISRSRVKPPGKYAPWRRAYATYQVRIGELQSEHWPGDSTGCSRSEMEAQTKRCTLHAGGRLPAGCLGRQPRRLDGEQIPKVSVHRTSILYRQYLGSWGACCVECMKGSYYVGTAQRALLIPRFEAGRRRDVVGTPRKHERDFARSSPVPLQDLSQSCIQPSLRASGPFLICCLRSGLTCHGRHPRSVPRTRGCQGVRRKENLEPRNQDRCKTWPTWAGDEARNSRGAPPHSNKLPRPEKFNTAQSISAR